jgi:hypothetical protein
VTELSVSALTTGSTGLKTGACPATPSEDAGNGASFSYVTQTDINLNNQANLNAGAGTLSSNWTIERRILVTGSANGQQRRVLATYRLNPGISPLFERYGYVECSTKPASNASGFNDSGCADPGV